MEKPGLHKTTIVIWSAFPGDQLELEDLAREATTGGAYCAALTSEFVANPFEDPTPPLADMFLEVAEAHEAL